MGDLIRRYRKQTCVLVFTLGFMILGMLAGLIFIRPVYTASASYLVTDTSGFHYEIIHPDEISEFFRRDSYIERLSEKTAGRFSSSELKNTVKIKPDRNSPVFRVKVTSGNATDVYFIQKTIETSNRYLTAEMSDEYFLVIQVKSAEFPERSVRPGFIFLTAVFSFLGAAASVVFIQMKKKMFTVSNTTESVLRFQVPVVARIPVYRKNKALPDRKSPEFTTVFLKNSGISVEKTRNESGSAYNPDRNTIMIGPQTDDLFFDSFRQFCSEVNEIADNQRSVILITSPEIGDGKTTAALNLGITAAAEGKSVLLVDCNLRNKRMMRAFNISQESPGLSEMIFGSMPARDAILFTEYHSLFILPQGRTQNLNPLTLLTRPETLSILKELKSMFHYIIIDCPPVNAFPDALALASAADHVFLTVRNKITQDSETEKALKSLELSEVKVSGFIINEAELFTENNALPVRSVKKTNRNRFISGFDL